VVHVELKDKKKSASKRSRLKGKRRASKVTFATCVVGLLCYPRNLSH
jgi:hypothetical protein